MATEVNYERVIKRIIRDVRVELDDEFDRNFVRQAFFSERWQRARNPARAGRNVLVDSGALRRSIGGRVSGTKITWESTLPYAAIHNDGGEIVVTAKMKKFFWYKYYSASKGIGRKKAGSKRQDKNSKMAGEEAEFWKRLALMKVGSSIKIPRRRFIGPSPEVERIVEDIIDENLEDFFEHYNLD